MIERGVAMPALRPSLAVVFMVILGAGCASPGGPLAPPTVSPAATDPSPSPAVSPSATPSPKGSPPPSLAPLPSVGQVAELVLRFQACDLGCGVDPGLIVLADGRVLRRAEEGMTVRQLTPAGLQLIRDTVEETGLLEDDATWEPKMTPGVESGGFGPMSYLFQAKVDETVTVRSVDPEPFDAENQRQPGTWAIPPQVYALEEVAATLKDLDATLPPEAWAGPTEMFVPEQYLVEVTVDRADEPSGGTDADAIRWPFGVPIDGLGDPVLDPADPNASPTRCLVISRAEAQAMVAAEGADEDDYPYRSIDLPFDSLMYPLARANATVSVATRMVLPYQEPTCDDAREW
jgi:hypothetical protein